MRYPMSSECRIAISQLGRSGCRPPNQKREGERAISDRAPEAKGPATRSQLATRYSLLVVPFLVAASVPTVRSAEPTTTPLAFKVMKVVSVDDTNTVINDAVVLVKDGKIEAVGSARDVKIPAGYRIREFTD